MDPIEHLNIARYLKEASLILSADQVQKLHKFHELLRQENPEINVTRLHSAESMGRKHYVDSLYPLIILEKAGVELRSPCMDVGSGGGFPGIPLAVARPDVQFRLVEGRRKRTDFLERVVQALDLPNVEVIARKLNPSDELGANTAISRAFMSIPDTLDLCRLSVARDGLFLFWKGPDCSQEIQEASQIGGWALREDLAYTLPGSEDRRRLVVFQRTSGAATDGSEVHLGDKKSVPGRLQSRLRPIESETNSRFRDWSRLNQSRMIRKLGLTIVSGRKIVPELLNSLAAEMPGTETLPPNGEPVALIFGDTLPVDLHEVLLATADLPIYSLKTSLLNRLDYYGTGYPVLLWSFPGLPAKLPVFSPPAACLVAPFSRPENLGAAIRTAAALGVAAVILTEESVHPFHPGVIRSSAGAVLQMQLIQGPALEDIPGWLSAQNVDSDHLLLDSGADLSIQTLKWDLSRLQMFFIGTEGQGLPSTLPGRRVRIPMDARVESLNAGVSAGILLYEWRRSVGD